MKKIVAVTVVFLLLPLLALRAQQLIITPEPLVSKMDKLTYPTATTHKKYKLLWGTTNFPLLIDEPESFYGPVRCVTTIYEIPDTLNSIRMHSHMSQNPMYDVLLSKTTNYTFSQQGELREIAEKYIMHSYYQYYRKGYAKFYQRHHKYGKVRNSQPKIRMEKLQGEKKWSFNEGKLVSYKHVNSAKDDSLMRLRRKMNTTSYHSAKYIEKHDSVQLQYDKYGNLSTISYFKYDNTSVDERFRFAYDSLGRMVYASWWSTYGDKYIYAYLYDSIGCVARVEETVGDSLGKLHRLYYEPQQDGGMKISVKWYNVSLVGGKSEYAALYKNPDSCLTPFFSKRFLNCKECGFARLSNYPRLYDIPGDYTFDSAGRLLEYNLHIYDWLNEIEHSNSVILYDTAGRIVEIKALVGTLLFYDDLFWFNDPFSRSGVKFIQFAYDDHGQLSEVNWMMENKQKRSVTIHYTYDEWGNWIRCDIWRDGRQTDAVRREIEYAE